METYTIQQMAAITGLSAYTLRYYENIGLVPPVPRKENGHRRYSDFDLDWINYVTCLRSVGMALEEIKTYVALQFEGDGSTLAQRIEMLENHRSAIGAQVERSMAILAELDTKIERYRDELKQHAKA